MTVAPPFPLEQHNGRAAGLVIRRANSSDLAAIAELESAAFATDRLSRRSIRALIAVPSARLLVAERGGAVTGYALVLLRRGSGVARLYSIAVARGESGRGTGQNLVASAETVAAQAGCRVLRLEVRADNERAIALYDGMGYGRIGERTDYYGDGMTAIRYEKPVGSNTGSHAEGAAAAPPQHLTEPSA